MRGSLLIFIAFLIIVSCSEQDLPAGIYDYQVERLLSGQEGSKTWSQIVNSADCSDSVKLIVSLIENSADDSLDMSFSSGCSSARVVSVIGRASATNFEGRDLFSDSLIFSDGSFWIVSEVTSERLTVLTDNQSLQFVSE